MDQPTQPPASQPLQPTQPITQQPAVPVKSPQKSSLLVYILIALVSLGVGAAISRVIYAPKPTLTETMPNVTAKNNKISLPTNAIQIQKCANNKGTLYVEPQNIPVGPVYMVNNGDVIGIEYMLSKDEFLAGKSYKFLGGLGLNVDHVNIGLLSQGHEGYSPSHYHVDMYTVSKDIEQAITCPDSATTPIQPTTLMTPETSATGSAASASPSASPAAMEPGMYH